MTMHSEKNAGHGFERLGCCRADRHGVAVISVIALFVISLTLFGLWAKAAVIEHRRLNAQQRRLQATRLAEAGLHRAIARQMGDSSYTGETWQVSADALGGSQTAFVEIRLNSPDDEGTTRIETIAEFPAGTVRRARVVRRTVVADKSPTLVFGDH